MKERFKVLCVGVNKVLRYKKLNYAERDAQTAAKYFETLKEKADVTLLTAKNATRQKILAWVKECSAIQEELTVILFFAGHGSAEKNDKTKNLERCLWIDGNPNIKRNSHQLYTSGILKLLNNPRHRLILLIDACYNFDSQQSISIGQLFAQFKETERITTLNRYAVISASAVTQVALEDPRIEHGILSYYFFQTMAGKYTFFLHKKIPFLKVLAALDKKVRNHRFLTDTGREITHQMLLQNGIMVHWSDTDFELPVLEPIPYIINPRQNRWQKKLSQWAHFFNRTRLRSKICFTIGILAAALTLLLLAHLLMVRIHFQYMGPKQRLRNSSSTFTYMQQTLFYNFLLGNAGLILDEMRPERMGIPTDDNFTLFLFKPNWEKAFLRRLDEKGKIILLGNYLGYPIQGVTHAQLLEYALDTNHRGDLLYWHPNDVDRFLENLPTGYNHLTVDQKKTILTLLADLGEKGKTTAVRIFDLKHETVQELRDLYLEHFYSPTLWEQNTGNFNLDDYICLMRHQHPIPSPNNRAPGQENRQLLYTTAKNFPGADTGITDTNKLAGLYDKLKLLAYLGSPDFTPKAVNLIKTAFDPDNILEIILICKDFDHRVWLLEQYFLHMKNRAVPDMHWWKLTYDLFKILPPREKSKMLKIFVDTWLPLIPSTFHSHLFRLVENPDPAIIGLSDWEQWIKKYPIDPYYVLDSITQNHKYPGVFPFIETHYDYFNGHFSFYTFEDLYQWEPPKTVRLAQKLYDIGSERDRFCCALFLYSKNFQEYSAYLCEFLRKALKNKTSQDILRRFYWPLTKPLLRLVDTHQISKEELRFLFSEKNLYYTFTELNLQLWPAEVKKRLMSTSIPFSDIDGIPLLRACEKLPGPYREKMLVKICNTNIDETFRLNAEISLIKYHPEKFLPMAFKNGYHHRWQKQERITEAYQALSYKELEQRLSLSFTYGDYRAIGFICKALMNKVNTGEMKLEDIREVLHRFNSPVERMLLRQMRYYLHQRDLSSSSLNRKNGPHGVTEPGGKK